jgi:hypothetical protein
MSARHTLYEVYIGYVKIIRLIETKIETNEARYVDSQSLHETKGNAERFRLIIDTLIDIVEKIEKLTPPFCGNCGCKLQNDAKFCYSCGAPVPRLPIQ